MSQCLGPFEQKRKKIINVYSTKEKKIVLFRTAGHHPFFFSHVLFKCRNKCV